MVKWFIVSLLLMLIPRAIFSQDNSQRLSVLAGNSRNWFEGFQKNVGGNIFAYDCFRNNVRNSLITRSTNGEMGIEWETQNLPESFDQPSAGFLWIASIDLTPDPFIFDVTVNGIKRFEITSSNKQDWQVQSADGGKLSYVSVATDRHQDVSGYMSLEAPVSWLVKGVAQKIGITGRRANSNTWIIVFQANDALAYLHGAAENNLWSHLVSLSKSNLGNGRIMLMNSSHQDIAWMDSPEKCVIERDTMLLTPLLKRAEIDKAYRFDIEDALMIKEYIGRHPDKRDLIGQLLADGRISCGSTFIQPYEEMYSGESLVRQFYLGAKWLKDEFNYKATVYWNEDVPGRTLQMPQIMAKAGSKYLMISRQDKGFFNWYSPDGSFVTGYSPGHYSSAFEPLQKNLTEVAGYLAESSLEWQRFYGEKSTYPIIPVLSDWDMSPAKDYSKLILGWKNISEKQIEKGVLGPLKLPQIMVVSTPEFFEELVVQKPLLPSISGERPAVWLYIHGPSHYEAIKASREADVLLPLAEKLSTINALVDGSFQHYPQARLNKAWESKIYPDHGWGGKHGDITDALFLQKYEFAKAEANGIVRENLNELGSKIKTNSKKGMPLVVFNGLNIQRTDPVSTPLSFEKGKAFSLLLTDGEGKPLNCQLSATQRFEDGSIRSACLNFVAENVPSVGYKTFYIQPSLKNEVKSEPHFQKKVSNQFYSITFSNGGISSIFDKELGLELIDSMKFKAGEIFTMRSVGNGAGEFSDIQKPDMDGYDKTGNYATKWELEETGAVYTIYKFRQSIRHAVVEQHVKLYHQQKRIDFETALLNWEGVLYREFRMAIPLKMSDGQVSYEVPFGVVNVGKDEMEGAAGERYTTPCKNIHPRGIMNWISSSNVDFGVTLSSSVAVADWIDPTDQPVKNQILQPILLASRKSCHGEGNEYLQTGNHTFRFTFTSHLPGWQNGSIAGARANETLSAVVPSHQFANASLPETMSFFHAKGENIILSTLKKAEDSNGTVIRLVDYSGKDQTMGIELFKQIKEAGVTNMIEQEFKPLKMNGLGLKLNLGHHAIETLILK